MTRGQFNTAQAAFLARAATRKETVTYGDFAKEFGGIAQGWGPKLTEMGERLKSAGLPLLPVLVVNKDTNLPSSDAAFYKRIGLKEEDIVKEQKRCFSFDWTTQPFWTNDK